MDSSTLSLAPSVPPNRSASATLRPLVLEPMRAHSGIEPVLLDGRKVVVGAADDCSLRLAVPGVEPRHCLILAGPHGPIIKAWDQRTWLNDRPVREAGLRDGDRLAIGPVVMRVRKARDDEASRAQRPAEPQPPAARVAEFQPAPLPPVIETAIEIPPAALPPILPPPQAITAPVPSSVPDLPAAEFAANPERDARRKRLLALRARRASLARSEEEANDLLAQLVTRRQELEQRSARLDGLEGRIRDALAPRERNLSETQASLAAERARLESFESELSARRLEVERREQEVEDRVRRAENAELLSARASASLARKRGLVSDLAGELLTHQGTIETQKRAIDHDRKTAQQQLSEAAARLADAGRQESALRKQLDELSTRESILSTRAEGVERQLRELSDEMARVVSQRTTLDERTRDLDARERSLDALRSDLSRRDAELQARATQTQAEVDRLSGLERELSERLRDVGERESQLQVRETTLADRDRQLVEREAELVSREQKATRQEAVIEVRQAELDGRETELDALRLDLDERTARLSDGEAALTREKTQVAEREQQLDEREASLAESEELLTAQTNLAQTRKAELDARSAQLEGIAARAAADREELDRVRLEQDQVRAELAAQRAELDVSRQDLGELREEMDREMVRLSAEEQRLDERNEELRRREQDLDDRLELASQHDAELDHRERLLADSDTQSTPEPTETANGLSEEMTAWEERLRTLETRLADEQARLEAREQELELTQRELDTRRQNLASIAALVGPAGAAVEDRPSGDNAAVEEQLAARQRELDALATDAAQRVTELETREAALIEQEAVLEAARTAAAELQSRLTQEAQQLDADRAEVEAERLSVEADRRVLDRQAEALNDQELQLTSRENELRVREERFHPDQSHSDFACGENPESDDSLPTLSVDPIATTSEEEPVVSEMAQAVETMAPDLAGDGPVAMVDELIPPALDLEPMAATVAELDPDPVGGIEAIAPDRDDKEGLVAAGWDFGESVVAGIGADDISSLDQFDERQPAVEVEAKGLEAGETETLPAEWPESDAATTIAGDEDSPFDHPAPLAAESARSSDIEFTDPIVEGVLDETGWDAVDPVVSRVDPVETNPAVSGGTEGDEGGEVSAMDGVADAGDSFTAPADIGESLLNRLEALNHLAADNGESDLFASPPTIADATEPTDQDGVGGDLSLEDQVVPPANAELDRTSSVSTAGDGESISGDVSPIENEKRQIEALESRLQKEREQLESLEQRWRHAASALPPVPSEPPVYGVNPFAGGVIFPGIPQTNPVVPVANLDEPAGSHPDVENAGEAAESPVVAASELTPAPVAAASPGMAGGGFLPFGMPFGAVPQMGAMPNPAMPMGPGPATAPGSAESGAPGGQLPAGTAFPPMYPQQPFSVIPMIAPPMGFAAGGFLNQIPSSDLPPTIKEEVPRPKSEPYFPTESGPLISSNSALGLPSELESLPHLDLSDDTAMLLGEASRMDDVADLSQLGLEAENHVALADSGEQGALLSEDDLAELQDSHSIGEHPRGVAGDGSVRSLLAEMFGIDNLGADAHDAPAEGAAAPAAEEPNAAFSADSASHGAELSDEVSDDDTIAEYMERLLARSRKGGGEEPTKIIPAMVPSLESSQKTIAPVETPVEELDLSHIAGMEPSIVPVHPVGPMVPRAKVNPNELRIRNEYLREVANRSARLALARHRQRQQRSARLFKGTVAVASLALGGSIFGGLVGGGELRSLYGLVALGISGFMGGSLALDFWQIRKMRQSANQERRHSPDNKPSSGSTPMNDDVEDHHDPIADEGDNHDTTAIIHQAVVAAEKATTTEE